MRNNTRQFLSPRATGYRVQRRQWMVLAVALLITLSFAYGAGAATITVTTPNQGIADDGLCSLQEAIYSANFDFGVAPSSFNPLVTFDTGCATGSGDDVIQLDGSQIYQMTFVMNDPYNPLGPTATPIILSNITIEANGATLLRSNPFRNFAGTNFRAFAVANASFADPSNDLHVAGGGIGNLTIRNAYIKGFTAKGGDGTDGGGGGMGAGGAIFVRNGTLNVEGCTFQDNGAGGGNGGDPRGDPDTIDGSFDVGGGGGGLAGKGGKGRLGGGGGGGARGNGGNGNIITCSGGWIECAFGFGGGGGGTLTSGYDGTAGSAVGGFRCGGAGAGTQLGDNGGNAPCNGGGGGGGNSGSLTFNEGVIGILTGGGGDGGDGSYGGGGGGGGWGSAFLTFAGTDGGHGGFGGGGGAAGEDASGGDGGFGGGGGAGPGNILGGPGKGGSFAGDGSNHVDGGVGGGGAGLGGAIFSDAGTVVVRNCTFAGNYALRGLEGGDGAGRGRDAGGAIFAVDGSLTVDNSTLALNESTGDGGGIVVYGSTRDIPGSLTIHNTIIANNGVRECFYTGDLSQITADGSGNLIMQNFGCPGPVPGATDPLLGPLQPNAPGLTPTMAIGEDSPAFDAGDNTYCLEFDQRLVTRATYTPCDIGAYELIKNLPPVAMCKDVTVSADANCVANASIDYGSYDPDGDPITLTQSPPGPYALGSTAVTLSVADDHNHTSTCNATVTVVDDTAAVINVKPPIIVFLNNHMYRTFSITDFVASVTDNCSTTLTANDVVISQVTSDEPDDALGEFSGDGKTINDIKIAADCKSVQLRQERDGTKDGRVYTVTLKVKDGSGNIGEAVATVNVPLSQNQTPAIDSGVALTVTGCTP